MLWSYYLGHVWGFLIVTNWATFVFLKRLFVKNTIKIGVSADFLFKAKGDPKFLQKGTLWGALFALDKLESPSNLMEAEIPLFECSPE